MGRRPKSSPPREWYETAPWRFSLWRSRSPVLRFGVTSALLMAAYYAAAITPAFDEFLNQALKGNALASDKLLNLIGMDCTAVGTTIRSPRFAVNVRRGCDAIDGATGVALVEVYELQ
jgi:hypothetical protein